MADDPLAQAVARGQHTQAELRDAIRRCSDIVVFGRRDEQVWTRDLAILLAALHAAREDAARLDWLNHAVPSGEFRRATEATMPTLPTPFDIRQALAAARAANQGGK